VEWLKEKALSSNPSTANNNNNSNNKCSIGNRGASHSTSERRLSIPTAVSSKPGAIVPWSSRWRDWLYTEDAENRKREVELPYTADHF
jgi:hypothetical protein